MNLCFCQACGVLPFLRFAARRSGLSVGTARWGSHTHASGRPAATPLHTKHALGAESGQ